MVLLPALASLVLPPPLPPLHASLLPEHSRLSLKKRMQVIDIEPSLPSVMTHSHQSCTSGELIDLVDRALLHPSGQSLIIAAIASNSVSTGLPWCSDCVQAKAAMDRVLQLAQQPDGQFVASTAICALAREEWKSEHGQSNHPLRLHSQLMVGGIPFVARVVDGKIIGRATEEECFSVEDLLKRLKMDQ